MYSVREFRANLKKCFDEAKASCVHIKRGNDVFELRLCTPKEEQIRDVATFLNDKEQRISHYGCGCPKTDDLLCQKHGRQ